MVTEKKIEYRAPLRILVKTEMYLKKKYARFIHLNVLHNIWTLLYKPVTSFQNHIETNFDNQGGSQSSRGPVFFSSLSLNFDH